MTFYLPSGGSRLSLNLQPALQRGRAALLRKPESLADVPALRSSGSLREFYSEGDYWWPDPLRPDGVPYMKRDGELNPDAFQGHRLLLRGVVERVGALTVAYDVTQDAAYRNRAAILLESFFLDPDRGMLPQLSCAQAVPGICTGRGIGIIDGLHLIDLLPALPLLFSESRAQCPRGAATYRSMGNWFASYLDWLVTSEQGRSERNEPNNHAISWAVQVAAIARLLRNETALDSCRKLFVERFLPEQMAEDGSFPREIVRTRPYNYAIFTLDLVVTLAHILSTRKTNLWRFQLADGRGVSRALEYLFPYLEAPERWPYPEDVGWNSGLPVPAPFMLLAARSGAGKKWLRLWRRLPAVPADREVRRNIAIKEPYLWL